MTKTGGHSREDVDDSFGMQVKLKGAREIEPICIYRFFTPDLDLDFENWKLIMVRKEADFVGQLRFGEDVEIRAYLLKIGNSSFTVGNEVWQSNELKAKGKTVIVHFDYVTQKSVPIPDDVRNKLEEHLISEEDIGKDI